MDKEKKPNLRGSTVQESEPIPAIGPHNPALGEIYQRLYPEIRRPKPDQHAIAAALQAMRQLTLESDAETDAEAQTAQTRVGLPCQSCGHFNRHGSKFCGGCGLPLGAAAQSTDPALEFSAATTSSQNSEPSTMPGPAHEVHASNPAEAIHHYHHHYHHHYFQGGQEPVAYTPRPTSAESSREADRLRIAAAAKGEPMSRGEAAVRRLTQEWILACNTRQLDELLDLYSPDALVLRTNLPPIRGAMALREFFHGVLEAGLGEVALDPIRVEVSGELAHEVGRYTALVPGTVGKRREDRGKYLWVFSRQSGGDWKLVSECWSSDLTLSDAESDFTKSAISTAKPRK